VVGSRAGKAATGTIPIIFVQVGDPVGVGLVPNLARPGGNLTGITNIAAELTGKRLELLKEIVVLLPIIEQLRDRGQTVVVRADAAFALPAVYQAMERREAWNAERRSTPSACRPMILMRQIEDLLTRP